MTFDLDGKKVFVCGHTGMVGSAVVRALKATNCIILTTTRSQLDLINQQDVKQWMNVAKPDVVIICAARVGGILANDSFPSEFLYQNLMIESNIIHASHEIGVEKLLFLGSSCVYPKFADQPIREEALLSGALESSNEWYAVAKIAGIKLCQAYRKQYGCDFISAMPTNLYGPGDNYDLQESHVIPALIRKCHEAKMADAPFIHVWGSGEVFREFMHVDDCADGIIFLLENYSDSDHVNVGVGQDITIKKLAKIISEVVGFNGELKFDSSFPSGTPRKLLDVERINKLGWRAKIGLRSGLIRTYENYVKTL